MGQGHKRLTDEQIQQFRRHAEQYPLGDTAKLLAHIDWQACYIEKMYDMLDDLPTSIEDLVDFTDCEGGE